VFCGFIALALGHASAADVSDDDLQAEFGRWMIRHGKTYPHDEFQFRWQTWKRNAQWIHEFNKRNASTFTVAMNKFGDLTSQEFGQYKGLLAVPQRVIPDDQEVVDTSSLPTAFDWRKKGVVTGVKNQEQCGSCWAFSATGSMEGAHAIHTGTLVGLSEQNLVDCSSSEGNQGCNGGWMVSAFQYIINNNGIDTETSYPYVAEDGTCHYRPRYCGSTLKVYKDVLAGSEASLQNAVATGGPVSVAIDASQPSFQFYSGGVYYEPECSSSQLDHGVLAVGYDTDKATSKAYWIVKNSWGTDCGRAGYIWMSRNRDNNCGIATAASWAQNGGANVCQ